MANARTLEELENEVEQLPLQEQLKLVARISQRLSSIPLAIASDQEGDYDFRSSPLWQLRGALRVAQPEAKYIVGNDAEGDVITNYSEHVDEVLYP